VGAKRDVRRGAWRMWRPPPRQRHPRRRLLAHALTPKPVKERWSQGEHFTWFVVGVRV
jgi:hypothetical protein